MPGDVLDSIEGPRTLQYFVNMIVLLVLLTVLGVILSQFYGFTLLERITTSLLDDPMALLTLASFFAFIALMVIAARFIFRHVE